MNSTDPSAGGGGGAGGGAGVTGGGAGGGATSTSIGRSPPVARRLWRRSTRLLAGSARAGDTRATLAGGVASLEARTRGSPMSAASGSGACGRNSGGSACRASSTANPPPTHLANVDHRTGTAPI
jgi:hypothetical protein